MDLEEYVMKLQIEARTLGDISRNHIIPTGIRYQNTLIENVKGLKEIYGKDYQKHAKEQMAIIERISQHIAAINTGVNAMIEARKKANILEDIHQKATAYCKEVFPFFHEIISRDSMSFIAMPVYVEGKYKTSKDILSTP